MALCKLTNDEWGWVEHGQVYILRPDSIIELFSGASEAGIASLSKQKTDARRFPLSHTEIAAASALQPALAAPLLWGQEVWAAGVTYESSKFARMSESEAGGDFYARVYAADRPELFFKATAARAVGHRDMVNIRSDATWSVPEPELAVVANAKGTILGYTVGNDMSSRDIEGANPLYLPQAKVYTRSCALGPWIVPAELVDPTRLSIKLTIERNESAAFEGETSTSRMKRSPEELMDWLFRDNEFPQGVILLTGTGIIPPDTFTLKPADHIRIEIQRIGVLTNTVSEKP
jgi:2-dehydro-3-deoxy-D-arabinonate dehydratase